MMVDEIVTRGQRYDRTTGRWLGPVVDEEAGEPIPVPEDSVASAPAYASMSKAELKELARDREIVGFSALNKAELVDALEALDLVGGDDSSDAE